MKIVGYRDFFFFFGIPFFFFGIPFFFFGMKCSREKG
jgi:hypothetical protein